MYCRRFFFVPSYHVVGEEKRHQLIWACEQLSLATGSTVVFINQSLDTQCAAIFVAGERGELTPEEDFYTFEFDPIAVKECEVRTQDIRAALSKIFLTPRS